MRKTVARKLDKFYTKPVEVERCYHRLSTICDRFGLEKSALSLIEPSAGSGAFLDCAHGFEKPVGYDILPESQNVCQADFLTLSTAVLPGGRASRIFIGNPPFGKKGGLAIDFLNKALGQGVLVAFIVPLTFRKWITQKRILSDAKLIADYDVPAHSFEFVGETYPVRCCFQVWSCMKDLPEGLVDLRQRSAPVRAHPDFEMWQYNATEIALKYFDYDWDFGVLRQGYGDYTHFVTKDDVLSRKKQWIFFKASDALVLGRLKSIDFGALAETNTAVLGFGKTEVVQAYRALVGESKLSQQTNLLDPCVTR